MANNIRLLRLLGLPVIASVAELAAAMHVDPARLGEFRKHAHRYYRKFKIPKPHGGFRDTHHPCRDLKAVQAWILRNILDRLAPSPYATAYVKGKSILAHVLPHSNNRYFLLLDLEDFFPSVSARRVAGVFSVVGYSKKMARILAGLCTCMESLPQGGVTSPSLSDLVTAKLDRRLASYTSRRSITYTRYADDITLSSNNRGELVKSLDRVRRIIASEHFRVNESKLRMLGPRLRCVVTGLVKDASESKFGVGRSKRRTMRAVMHRLASSRPVEGKYDSEKSVDGWLSYLQSIDAATHHRLASYWSRLRSSGPLNEDHPHL